MFRLTPVLIADELYGILQILLGTTIFATLFGDVNSLTKAGF